MQKSARAMYGAILLFGMFCYSNWIVAAGEVEIINPNPRYLEPVYARIRTSTSECVYGAQATMSDNIINLTYQYFRSELCPAYFYVELGRFPSGSYAVLLRNIFGAISSTDFYVSLPLRSDSAPGTVPAVNYSDIWWNPAEPGWGISITQGPTNVIFAAWFVYDDITGEPAWYTLQSGQWNRADIVSAYTGSIYKTVLTPTGVKESLVGAGKLTFSDSSRGEFVYTFEGVTGRTPIVRFPVN